MSGEERWGYLPPRPGPRKRHQVRRILLVLGASVAAGYVLGRRLAR